MLTLREAGERAGLSANTLRTQVKRKVIPAVLVGKTYLVAATDIDTYIAQHKGRRGGFQDESHPLHGKRGGGGRQKKTTTSETTTTDAPRAPQKADDVA